MRKLLFCIGILIFLFYAAWPGYAGETDILWTEAELAFLNNHPVIRLGIDPAFVPFEFIDQDGEYKGITADYISKITDLTGLEFTVVRGLTWPEAYDRAISGEIDVLPAISKTADRDRYFIFSNPYYYFKRVIVTRDTNSSIKGIEDLEGSTVAVQRNSSHHSYLISHPGISLSLYDSVETALTSVANGTETAFVGNLASTNYLIKSNGLTNLKFIAFEAEKQSSLHLAVRKDWPELVGILNKALSAITEEEKNRINNKWVPLESETDNGPLIQTILMIGSLILLVWTVSVYWIIRLRKEISNRKKIQTDLEKAKSEAEDANNVKSSFMARMSHEIWTPLNAITGLAYLLKKTNLSLTQKMNVDKLTQASTNMLSVINDILDYSKIEAGKVELEVISFNLDQVIQDVINIVSYKIEEQAVTLKLTKDPKVPGWFYGDAKRIEQILLNIMNNAAKFTSTGEVSLDIRLVAKQANQYHLAFTIKDTGIGMTEDQVKQLFEPFSQVDSSINRRFGGTGLGLSIVKNLVDMMQGEIQVFSTPGEGSTFIIHLTLESDLNSENEYKNQLSADYFKNIKTLVLEKPGTSMNIIDSYLCAFGMGCEVTTSQEGAISLLEAANRSPVKPFDLLIIDYEVPSEGGFEFLEVLRQNKGIVKMPKIIMLLPTIRDDLFDKLDDYGVDIGIGKPIIPSILLNGILDIFKYKLIADNPASGEEPADQCGLTENWRSILVVEDNKTNQLIAKSLLQQACFTVLQAYDGQEGVDVYRAHREEIDLVLMDLHMPVLSGYDAAKEIRKMSENVPIVAMTADVIHGVKEKCEAHGINQYISKPFDPDRFIETVKSAIKASSSLKDVRPNILDRAAGIRNLGGDAQLYKRVLHEFHTENSDTAERLSQAIEEKRYADAIQIVHKIKSSSGSIGAKLLHRMAAELQKALEECREPEIDPLRQQFTGLLTDLMTEIQDPEK